MKRNEEKMTDYNSERISAPRAGFYNPGMAGPRENTQGYFLRSGVTEDTPLKERYVFPGNASQDFVRKQKELYTIKRD